MSRIWFINFLCLAFLLGSTLGAAGHEADMFNNCIKHGVAKSWFYKLSCKEMKEEKK